MEKDMPQAGAMENDVAKPGEAVRHAKVTNKVIECCIHLTVFQGKVVINSGCRDKDNQVKPCSLSESINEAIKNY